MPRRVPWLLLLFAGISIARAAASPDPEVWVEARGTGFAVTARVSVEVGRATAWAVITDYNRLGEFVPDMDESRIVSRAGEPTLVQQTGAWNLLGIRLPVRVVAQVEEDPMRSVRFHSISGNVRVENGEWSIADEGDGVAITYHVECTPEFWVPPILGTMMMRRDVQTKLEHVAREMLRRDASQKERLPRSLPEPAS
jgi:hypothetical protein